MTCLKPNVGLGMVREDTPGHLPPDQGMFNPQDLIYGSLDATPHVTKFDVPCNRDAKDTFEIVKNVTRKKLYNKLRNICHVYRNICYVYMIRCIRLD